MADKPWKPGCAMRDFENIIITPHMAGGSDLVNSRRLELFKENIRPSWPASPC